MLKCKAATWGDVPDDISYEYCLTDSGGVIVPEDLVIEEPDGIRTDQALSWTLEYRTIGRHTIANPGSMDLRK